MRRYWPTALTLLLAIAYVGYRLIGAGWDPAALAEVADPNAAPDDPAAQGYDGQYVLAMALDLSPEQAQQSFDEPAYRYQRVLLPLVARLLALGNPNLIPWTLLLVSLAAHVSATWLLNRFAFDHTVWPGASLLYGLWAGSLVGIGAVLHEPLAYGLAAAALILRLQGHARVSLLLLLLAALAKETTLVFVGAFMLVDGVQGRWRRRWPGYGLLLASYAAWQLWLWLTFGESGVGSGGALATGFEWVPFLGFFRIATVDMRVFLVYLLLFGPGILVPTLFALYRGMGGWLAGERNLLHASLVANGLIMIILPYSTYREPLGMIRLATGLVLSLVVWAVATRHRRTLAYGWFWLAYLALIVG
jgi:hypothetical protein